MTQLQSEMFEAKQDLLRFLGLDETHPSFSLDAMAFGESKFIRDTKLNVKNALNCAHLTPKEAMLVALASVITLKNEPLKVAFTSKAVELGATEQEIGEVHACSSLLAVNNVLYRFRHFSANKVYDDIPAKVKMTIMMNPALGKEFFELVSLAVSAINGCESCVNSHEQSVREHGGSAERIFDAIRIASVITGLSALVH